MVFVIVRIERARSKHKKYTAIVRDSSTGRERRVNFGDSRYQQFRDSTSLRLYSGKDHGDAKRRRAYFMRHSGVETKDAAIKREKTRGITPRLLSHMYLW